jgi:predicted transcriptional regulator
METGISQDEREVLIQLNRSAMTESELARALRWSQPKANRIVHKLSRTNPQLVHQTTVTLKWVITRHGRSHLI